LERTDSNRRHIVQIAHDDLLGNDDRGRRRFNQCRPLLTDRDINIPVSGMLAAQTRERTMEDDAPHLFSDAWDNLEFNSAATFEIIKDLRAALRPFGLPAMHVRRQSGSKARLEYIIYRAKI
jgi:hypothetical protein